MQILNKFNTLSSQPNMISTLDAATKNLAENFDCVRIGIIQEFFANDLTASVLIVNKKHIGLNPDGTPKVQDYPLIYAKVCYCSPFETFPLRKGDECLLLFSDREIESWFVNGDINTEKYPRMHDKTDAIAICGLRSLPNMITILQNCLNLFYGYSNIAIADELIRANSHAIETNTTGTTTINAGSIIATATTETTINAETINLNGNVVINGKPFMDHTHSNGNQGNPTGGVIE